MDGCRRTSAGYSACISNNNAISSIRLYEIILRMVRSCRTLQKLEVRDVEKCDDSTDERAGLVHGIRPIFDGEAGSVVAPHHFVRDVGPLSFADRDVYLTLFIWVRTTVGVGVVHKRVHIFAK